MVDLQIMDVDLIAREEPPLRFVHSPPVRAGFAAALEKA